MNAEERAAFHDEIAANYAFTSEEADQLIRELGIGVIRLIRASQMLGHRKVSSTALHYSHLPYPPETDQQAAVSVVVDMAKAKYSPEELLIRHPWIPLVEALLPFPLDVLSQSRDQDGSAA